MVGDRSFWSGGGHFGLAMASLGGNILVVVWESHRGLLFIEFFTRPTGHELDHPTGHELDHPTGHDLHHPTGHDLHHPTDHELDHPTDH